MKKSAFTIAATAVTIFVAGCAGPDSLIRVHAYPKPKKTTDELAVVFGIWEVTNQMYICDVDGKSYSKIGAISDCPSVIYIPTGKHELKILNRYTGAYATQTILIDATAGKTYQIAYDESMKSYTPNEMPTTFKLKYKDLIPNLKEKYKEMGEAFVSPIDAE